MDSTLFSAKQRRPKQAADYIDELKLDEKFSAMQLRMTLSRSKPEELSFGGCWRNSRKIARSVELENTD